MIQGPDTTHRSMCANQRLNSQAPIRKFPPVAQFFPLSRRNTAHNPAYLSYRVAPAATMQIIHHADVLAACPRQYFTVFKGWQFITPDVDLLTCNPVQGMIPGGILHQLHGNYTVRRFLPTNQQAILDSFRVPAIMHQPAPVAGAIVQNSRSQNHATPSEKKGFERSP